MQHTQAVEMLSRPNRYKTEKQVWADLGCGSGTFTLALAQHLPPGSRVIAVDKDPESLQQIPGLYEQVTIEKRVANFEDKYFLSENLDGILMANSLHFVQDQKAFINRIKSLLQPDGAFLIVEYDMNTSNPWVPYPVSYDRLKQLFINEGFQSVRKLNEKPSRYNRSNLYSASIQYS